MKNFLRSLAFIIYILFITSSAFAEELDCNVLIKNTYNIPTATSQVVVVVPDKNLGLTYAKIAFCERGNDNNWKSFTKYRDFIAIVGEAGIAKPGEKREGDKKTPSGLFYIGETFGYYPLASSEVSNIRTDYRYITDNDFDKFVDDTASPNYNSWIVGATEAKSYEKMRRDDNLYEYGAVINYNMNPAIAGLGSAIFLHIWGDSKTYTSGCIALKKPDLLSILGWLDKAKQPQILIIPG